MGPQIRGMPPDLAILVPVLRRPHRVAPLLNSIRSTVEATTLFIADPDDEYEIEALEREDAEFVTLSAGFAAKINLGIRESAEPLIFIGADDLDFKPGWFERSRRKLLDGIQVVGVNDMLRRQRDHATHFLVTREYAEREQIDGQPGLLHEGYSHSFVDDELIGVAKARGVYAYAPDACVQHLHYLNGKAPRDETYELGLSRFHHDRRLFRRREAQWT